MSGVVAWLVPLVMAWIGYRCGFRHGWWEAQAFNEWARDWERRRGAGSRHL